MKIDVLIRLVESYKKDYIEFDIKMDDAYAFVLTKDTYFYLIRPNSLGKFWPEVLEETKLYKETSLSSSATVEEVKNWVDLAFKLGEFGPL
jgi:hypothetical protein